MTPPPDMLGYAALLTAAWFGSDVWRLVRAATRALDAYAEWRRER